MKKSPGFPGLFSFTSMPCCSLGGSGGLLGCSDHWRLRARLRRCSLCGLLRRHGHRSANEEEAQFGLLARRRGEVRVHARGACLKARSHDRFFFARDTESARTAVLRHLTIGIIARPIHIVAFEREDGDVRIAHHDARPSDHASGKAQNKCCRNDSAFHAAHTKRKMFERQALVRLVASWLDARRRYPCTDRVPQNKKPRFPGAFSSNQRCVRITRRERRLP